MRSFQNNIVDLIIYLIKKMHVGANLKEIRLDHLKGYNKAEISAAYSWLIQKHESGELQPVKSNFNTILPPRALYYGEKNELSKEVYGYLLELYYLGILNARQMEQLIEFALTRYDNESTEVSDIKALVAKIIFEGDYPGYHSALFLKGNETIN